MTYTTDLEKKATRWANYLAKNNKFQHETSSPGNLYMTSIQESNPCRVAVTAFYSEEKKYNYKKPGWSTATGHFTQVNICNNNNKLCADHFATFTSGKVAVFARF